MFILGYIVKQNLWISSHLYVLSTSLLQAPAVNFLTSILLGSLKFYLESKCQISLIKFNSLASIMNHLLPNKDENANEIRAVSKIKAGEEITLTYNWKQLAMKDWKTRQDNLWYNWGFRQAYSSFNNFFMTIILWGKVPSLFNILSRFNNSTVGRFFLLTVRGSQYYLFH